MRSTATKPPPDLAVQYIIDNKLWRRVAQECGIKENAARQWFRVPPARVAAVRKVTGLTRHAIRPDIFPRGTR